MSDFQLSTPVAFLVFNRPDTTTRVFEEIRRARPPKLLVVADGPRSSRLDEAERCAEVRRIVAEGVDWDCEVLTNFAEQNMGCKRRVSSGLDWVFGCVPEAIILEDDCLPHPTFFRYCQELLERYRDDESVMHISGNNFLYGTQQIDKSYYFSRYAHIWGWASWQRAWQYYNLDMSVWPKMRNSDLLQKELGRSSSLYWTKRFDMVHDGKIDTWDYQWLFSLWTQKGFCIAPAVNLVHNIGFGNSSTHTHVEDKTAPIPMKAMSFPLKHPSVIVQNKLADEYEQKTQYAYPGICKRAVTKASHILERMRVKS